LREGAPLVQESAEGGDAGARAHHDHRRVTGGGGPESVVRMDEHSDPVPRRAGAVARKVEHTPLRARPSLS